MTRTRERGQRRRRRRAIAVLAGTAALVAACVWYWGVTRRNRTDVLLQRARIAVAHAKGEQAIEFADAVIRERPGDAMALQVRAQAEAILGRFEESLRTLGAILREAPDRVDVQRMLADVLVRAGKSREAVEAYRRALALGPDDAPTWGRLARTLSSIRDFPAAEKAYRRAVELETTSRADVLVELGLMYMSVGLERQALDAFDEVIRSDEVLSVGVLTTLGRALESLGALDRARECLAKVPPSSNQYAATQVLLSRIDRRQGRPEDGRPRIEAIARDPAQAVLAVGAMAGLNVRHGPDRELIRWVDPLIDLEKLPPPLRTSWLQFRVVLADEAGDWPAAMSWLNALAEGRPQANGETRGPMGVDAARIALLGKLGETDEARCVLGSSAALASSGLGRLIAAVLGEEPKGPAGEPLYGLFECLLRGDGEGARDAAQAFRSHPTFYGSDVLGFLKEADLSDRQLLACCRQLAVAMIARESELVGLSGALCREVLVQRPSLPIAYALASQVCLDRGLPTDDLIAQLRARLPDGCLLRYLVAKQMAEGGDRAGSIRELRVLADREPSHLLVRRQLSGLLVETGHIDEALAILEPMCSQPGAFQVSAANALACLLAEHRLGRLDEAYRLAGSALQAAPGSKPVLDTFAWVEHLRGNDERALSLLTMAVHGGGSEAELHRHLGDVYSSLGETAWASYHRRQADKSASDASAKTHPTATSRPSGPVACVG
ncbi:MAG: tetratricopeptide repeat protein [Phycisphaerae bacterium]|nr:tetratricopeptide repeat protein [Phycisphaerae bacterium]